MGGKVADKVRENPSRRVIENYVPEEMENATTLRVQVQRRLGTLQAAITIFWQVPGGG